MVTTEPCIYCSRPFEPHRGQGDHVLPSRVFGEFKGDKRFRGVCATCNNRFGRYEQQLSQAGPLGFLRSIVKPNLGRRKNRGSLKQRGALGAPPPLSMMRFNGQNVLVDRAPDNPRNVVAVDQAIIVDADGGESFVRLYPNMTKERLRSDIEKLGVDKVKTVRVQCANELGDHFKSLLSEIYPDIWFEQEPEIEPGNYQVPIRAEFRVTVPYSQALAKIAFHYYLIHNLRGVRGDEQEFASIRNFIGEGGEPDHYFQWSDLRFVSPYGDTVDGGVIVPKDWAHLFAVDESGGEIVVYCQLYLGPEVAPPPFQVTLGRTESRIVVPNGVWGHAFVYDEHVGGKYAGYVIPVSMTRLAR